MKKYIIILNVMLSVTTISVAQGVGIGTSTPHPSARLHIAGTGKGILIPRTNTSGMYDIASPAKGLMLYDTSRHELMVNMGTGSQSNWKPVTQNSSWAMKGNAGTDPNTYFIGTTDNMPLHFRIQNKPAGKIDSTQQSTFLGYKAGQKVTSGNNTAVGYFALGSPASNAGHSNSAFGSEALKSVTTAQGNSAFGVLALSRLTTGTGNTAVGINTLEKTTTGNNNVAIGDAALYANLDGEINTAVGTRALLDNTTGLGNAAFGYSALSSNTTAQYNTAVGSYSLSENVTGDFNCALGYSSLTLNTSGVFNIGIGVYALNLNTTGNENSAMGYRAMESNTNGIRNVAVGVSAMGSNTTGSYNNAIGYRALESNTTGGQNTAMGLHALFNSTASSFNTAIGMDAGRYHNLGWNNTFIGSNANASAGAIFNSIALGEGATATASNQARIGNVSIGSIGGFVNWSNISDGRYKKNVREDVAGLDFIMRLRPVTYQLDARGLHELLVQDSIRTSPEFIENALAEKEAMLQSGFIAQEVEQAAIDAHYTFSGVDQPKHDNDLYALRYAEFVVPLVKAMQELVGRVGSQQQEIETLRNEVEVLRADR